MARMRAGDAVADPLDPAQALDVHVDQFAGRRRLVADDHGSVVERREPAQSHAPQDRPTVERAMPSKAAICGPLMRWRCSISATRPAGVARGHRQGAELRSQCRPALLADAGPATCRPFASIHKQRPPQTVHATPSLSDPQAGLDPTASAEHSYERSSGKLWLSVGWLATPASQPSSG